jgi:hypothetical protein
MNQGMSEGIIWRGVPTTLKTNTSANSGKILWDLFYVTEDEDALERIMDDGYSEAAVAKSGG